jgi:hypothetical protein
MIVESYLLAGDPNSERTNAHYKKLEELGKSASGEAKAQSRAQKMLELRNKVVTDHHYRFDYRNIAAKIDLAASFRD